MRYEHLNLVALRSSPEEVYQFIWNNAAVLGIDVRFPTRVERVLASTRVGPDGLIVNEILADYVQTLHTTADNLPPGMHAPRGHAPRTRSSSCGAVGCWCSTSSAGSDCTSGSRCSTSTGRTARLRYLYEHGVRGADGSFGVSDGLSDLRRFAQLHRGADA